MDPKTHLATTPYQFIAVRDLENQYLAVEMSGLSEYPTEKRSISETPVDNSGVSEPSKTGIYGGGKRGMRQFASGVGHESFTQPSASYLPLSGSPSHDESRFNRRRDIDFQQATLNNYRTNHIDGGVSLTGALKNFDQDTRILTVSWSGLWQDYANMEPVPLANGSTTNGLHPSPILIYSISFWVSQPPSCSVSRLDIETLLYRDIDTTVLNLPADPANNLSALLIFVPDNATAPHIATIGTHVWDGFDTDIEFQGQSDDGSVWRQPIFGYPWDSFTGNIVFVASDYYTSVFLNVSAYVFTLSGARLTDNSLNWRFTINATTVCPDPTTIPNAFDRDPTTLDNEILSQFVFPCQLNIGLTATRPPLVQFAVVMAVFVNWTSTLFIFVLTCEVLVMRRGWMLSGTDLLGVTFTALFALPTVRSLLPGAPNFGILNLVGIIPNVILISLCITAIALAKLNRRAKPEDYSNGKED